METMVLCKKCGKERERKPEAAMVCSICHIVYECKNCFEVHKQKVHKGQNAIPLTHYHPTNYFGMKMLIRKIMISFVLFIMMVCIDRYSEKDVFSGYLNYGIMVTFFPFGWYVLKQAKEIVGNWLSFLLLAWFGVREKRSKFSILSIVLIPFFLSTYVFQAALSAVCGPYICLLEVFLTVKKEIQNRKK